jgi:hypothetical protein
MTSFIGCWPSAPQDQRHAYLQPGARGASERHALCNFRASFGVGLERAMLLADAAEAAGCLERYILSVMQGVWADGIDTATDAGLGTLSQLLENGVSIRAANSQRCILGDLLHSHRIAAD